MQKRLLPKYSILSANLHTGAISAWGRKLEVYLWLHSAAAQLLKIELLTIQFNIQNAKQEQQTLLLVRTVTEMDFGQRVFRRTAWQDSAHLSFDGLSFTMDHRVWSHYAVWTRICLHHFELHCTHPPTHQEDVTCKTPHFSTLLQPPLAKRQPLCHQQPQKTRTWVT